MRSFPYRAVSAWNRRDGQKVCECIYVPLAYSLHCDLNVLCASRCFYMSCLIGVPILSLVPDERAEKSFCGYLNTLDSDLDLDFRSQRDMNDRYT